MADRVPRQRIGKDLAGNEAGLRDDQRGSSGERHQQFHDRSVETGRGELQDARVGSDAEPLDLGSGEARDADMRDDDGFWGSGGAGGVDDVGGVERGKRCGAVLVARVGVGLAGEDPVGVGIDPAQGAARPRAGAGRWHCW